MSITWYTDQSATMTHAMAKELLSKFVEELCPGHSLSHLGINRDVDTNNVELRLHLVPSNLAQGIAAPPAARLLGGG